MLAFLGGILVGAAFTLAVMALAGAVHALAKPEPVPRAFRTYEEGVQVPPEYYNYTGGYSAVTRCRECGRTALREDQHPVSPCKACGGKIDDRFIGKWLGNEARWKLLQEES